MIYEFKKYILLYIVDEAFKICLFNGSSNRPFWSLTNYTRCLQPSVEFVENLEESTIMEVDEKY
jgi:hypothetical protein